MILFLISKRLCPAHMQNQKKITEGHFNMQASRTIMYPGNGVVSIILCLKWPSIWCHIISLFGLLYPNFHFFNHPNNSDCEASHLSNFPGSSKIEQKNCRSFQQSRHIKFGVLLLKKLNLDLSSFPNCSVQKVYYFLYRFCPLFFKSG